jgi:hypothetical protein
MRDNPATKGATPLPVKQPSSAKGKAMPTPKGAGKDKAMPVKGKGK